MAGVNNPTSIGGSPVPELLPAAAQIPSLGAGGIYDKQLLHPYQDSEVPLYCTCDQVDGIPSEKSSLTENTGGANSPTQVAKPFGFT